VSDQPQPGIKVLFVSHSSGLQGSERSLLDLLLGLRTCSRTSHIQPLVLTPAYGALTEELQHERINFLVLPYKAWLNQSRWPVKIMLRILFNIVIYPLIRSTFCQLPIDLVYTNTVSSPIGALLALSLRVPHIWHIREFVHEDMHASYAFGTRASMRFIEASSCRIITNSQAVQHKMARFIQPQQLTTVYNGVLNAAEQDPLLVRQHGLAEKRPVTLCIVGTICEHKGQVDALHGCAALRRRGVNAVLRVVGIGAPDAIKALQRLAVRLGIDNCVHWEGFSTQVPHIFETSDIALVCSRHEAFGRVAVEAMAAGCPVVGTAAGGLTEVIVDGETGLLYSPGDRHALVACLVRLIEDPALYIRVSHHAQAAVYQRFTRQRYVAEIAAVIDACASSPAASTK
jgi:glycosyltransferase involved in cell wall biosynthesis